MTDTLIQLARAILPSDSYSTFSERALWFAGESQKVTAIPAPALVASSSLLVVELWIAVAGFVWRRVTRLMGFPLGWTDLGASATPSSRRSSRSSGGR